MHEEVVQGPLDHPEYGKTVFIRPTIATSRAGRFPTQAVIVTAAARCLIALAKEGERLKAIIVEGSEHDPTVHPEFNEISKNLRELINKHFPKVSFKLFADAADLSRAQTRHALVYYDQPIVRFEAGFQKTFTALSGEDPKNFKERIENLGRLELEKLILRATFVRGSVDNSKENEIKAWIKYLAGIKPAAIHISTPSKPAKKTLKAITKTRMTEIAELVTEKTGIPVEVTAG